MDKPWKVRFLAWKVHLKAWKVRLKAWTTAHNACLIGSDAPKPLSLQHCQQNRISTNMRRIYARLYSRYTWRFYKVMRPYIWIAGEWVAWAQSFAAGRMRQHDFQ